jgi:hypothetical protein
MKLPRTSVEGFELLGRSLYGLRRALRITDINSLLQALEWVPVGAEQSLEEGNLICRHDTPPLPSPNNTLNFLSPDKCRCEQKVLTLDWVPVSLKSKSWDWLGRFATAARLPILLCVHYSKESRKKEASYGAGRDSDAASAPSRRA